MRAWQRVVLAWIASSGLVPAGVRAESSPDEAEVRLVLWITVDQLRGDLPWRYLPRSSSGGFDYLARHGLCYRDAHYQHGITFTAVGHATLFTGGHVGEHGIPGNDWYDSAAGCDIDTVEDDRFSPLGEDEAKGNAKACSPVHLTSTTIGDELVIASAARSRVFSVSGKDRGAVLPGGHLGKSFWYSKVSGRFITSSYYYKTAPPWLTAWNDRRLADEYRDHAWTLMSAPATYLHAERDDRPCEKGYKHLGRTFPHALATDRHADFYGALAHTPFGDELTIQLVEELMRSEKVGQRGSTDFLAISLSATDQIGHAWGPESLEAEDNVRRLDVLLGNFFARLDRTVGLDRTLIILSADHGMDDIPECAEAMGLPAGRHQPSKFLRTLNEALRRRFTVDRDLAFVFWSPCIYLDVKAIGELGLDLTAVERAAAEEMGAMPGIAFAAARSDLLTGRVPDTRLGRAALLAFHPTRSGNVMIFPQQHWYLYYDPEKYAATHGSPHACDTFVPIMVAGPGIPHRTVWRRVTPADLAPSVAAWLGIKPPSGSTGQVLPEMLEQRASAWPVIRTSATHSDP